VSHELFFQQRLRVAMAVRDVNITKLARAVGVSRSMVSQMTKGKKFPSSSNLIAICTFLEVSLDWIMEPEPVLLIAKERLPSIHDYSGD
jgi:transcriptional regulator with XRE-family HTH domain